MTEPNPAPVRLNGVTKYCSYRWQLRGERPDRAPSDYLAGYRNALADARLGRRPDPAVEGR
ncbi:hypothetical protein A5784_31225 [Mycobacterium sp. 852013-50091_SCH5140682]|nr:hypothetical protein A5784_31225 [Mycobacterium sp. 852013-50091_SCH5140682]